MMERIAFSNARVKISVLTVVRDHDPDPFWRLHGAAAKI